MKLVDSNYDPILKSNYDLFSIQLSELKKLAKSWYPDVNLKDFDDRHLRSSDEQDLVQMKLTGLASNYFFAYCEDGRYYLMDGFNRLFTEYGQTDIDPPVYLKVLTSSLKDHWLMYIMYMFNMWKLKTSSFHHRFDIVGFMDRGFRLFLYSKFNILFDQNDDYQSRTRKNTDLNELDLYFKKESYDYGIHKYDYSQLAVLFHNERIIEDIREIVKYNDYKEQPFKHYETFFRGFMMYLSERRLKGDMREHKFQTYIDLLQKDTKFYKKLQGMSWTDSTRKNVCKFYRLIENPDFGKPKPRPEKVNIDVGEVKY